MKYEITTYPTYNLLIECVDVTVKKRFYSFPQPIPIILLCIVHHLSYPASRDLRLAARRIPLARDGACGAEALKLLCTELLKRSSFLFFPAEEKKRSKEKKAPAGRNLPRRWALFCSAVNAFAVRADSYSDIHPGVPLTAARRKRAPSVWRAYRGSPPANFAQPALSTVTLLWM